MVVRRIREHVATHNWFAVALDVVIVVLGVFIATQVSNWNEARGQREVAENYRYRLIAELQSDEAQIRQKIRYYQVVRQHGLSLLSELQRPAKQLGAPFLVDAYELTQVDPARGKRFIFDEMVGAGLLGLLGSEEVQRLASDYYQQLELYDATLLEVFPYRDILRQEMPYAVQLEIRDRCPDRNVYEGGKYIGIERPQECAISLSPAVVADAVAKLRATPKLRETATRYLSSVDQKLINFGDTLERATALREALSRAS